MIILPTRNECRTKFLMPVPMMEWREPSTSNNKTYTKFRIRAKTHDGVVLWTGWFDSRDDYDAFLWSLLTKRLSYESAVWSLSTPAWPGLDEGLLYDFATLTFLTTTGSNQTYNTPADWTNTENSIECLGAGGGGSYSSDSGGGNGGGGGAYTKVTNVTISGAITYRVGALGAGSTTGAPGGTGGDTWFNDTVYPTTGSNKVGAKGGGGGSYGGYTAGAGGASASGYPASGSTRYQGGNGGAANPTTSGGAGGGGAAGKNGNGNVALNVDSSQGTNGGSGDAGFGGAGGIGASSSTQPSTPSGGTEWSASFGSGGGGGGGGAGGGRGGHAGAYGAGGGGGGYNTGGGGDGTQGLIVITYGSASSKNSFNMPILGM